MKTIVYPAFAAALSTSAFAADLEITHFTPNQGSIFPVSSSLIEGPTELVLVDAQFEKDDARALVEQIKKTGKTLTTIYISHKDPDFYFGLDELQVAFPDASIVASPATVDGIQKSIQPKFNTWAPILKDNAPTALIVPDALPGDTLTVDGESINVVGLDGHNPTHTFLWVPSQKTALGGVVLFENMHVWMADSQTEQERMDWKKTLDDMLALAPERIIPGHVAGESAGDESIVQFTSDYIDAFVAASDEVEGSGALIAKMQAAYPDFSTGAVLSISAQVFEGERQWP